MKKCAIFILLATCACLFSTQKSDISWFGYVRSGYQVNIVENAEDYGAFRNFLTVLGMTAKINDHSLIFLDGYFNYPGVSSITHYNYDGETSGEYIVEEYGEYFGLLDAEMRLSPLKNIRVGVGQYVTFFGIENLSSSSKIDFINRGYIVRNCPPYRDLGAYVSYKNDFFGLTASVQNGAGMNVSDKNKYKNIILRGETTPLKNLTFAGSASLGKDNNPNLSATDMAYYAGGISYKTAGFQTLIEGSYKDYFAQGTTAFSGYGLYEIKTKKKLLKSIIPAVRYDFLDAPGDDNRLDRYTLGLSFAFDDVKWLSMFRINYEICKSQTTTDPPDALILELQMRFE